MLGSGLYDLLDRPMAWLVGRVPGIISFDGVRLGGEGGGCELSRPAASWCTSQQILAIVKRDDLSVRDSAATANNSSRKGNGLTNVRG